MMKLLTIITFSILLILQGFELIAQKIKVVTTSIEDVDNKLLIKYDLLKSKAAQYFIVSLEITNSEGYPIPVKSLSGDIGDNISGGTNKQIVWDYNADKIIMQQDINIQVVAYLKGEKVGLSKALILSTLWPGMGMYKKDKGKPYWMLGIAGYGSLGASYFLNKKANDNYDAYIRNNVDEQNDKLLSKSQNQNRLSKTVAYSAIGIWCINMVWTTIKAKNFKQKGVAMYKNQNLIFYTVYDPYTKTSGFTLKLNF
jgi:hypothetical protein